VLWMAVLLSSVSGMVFPQSENLNITIGKDTMQTLRGFGFNLTHYQPWVDNLPALQQEAYVKELVNKWGFSSAQLWGDKWGTPCCGSDQDPRFAADTTQFGIRPNVLQTVKWLQEAGMENILMMPIRDRMEAHHVDFWTNCALMWQHRGVDITAMSFLNKPNTGHGFQDSGTTRREPDSIVSGIKALRRALDLKGFGRVAVYGPSVVEWHPRQFATFGDSYDFEDGDTAAYLYPLLADTAAFNSFSAVDMQSYGRGLTNTEYGLAKDYGKELWVSLSATDGLNNNMNDPILGPITAGNVLSNLNHGVSLWHHWLLSDLTNADGSFKQRMFYLVNISTRITPGARMRQCTSDHADLPSPDMRWNYNLNEDGSVEPWQPDIITTAGENPDGSWFIGIVNLSGIHSQHKASVYAGEPKTYQVRFSAEELNPYQLLFDVYKCSQAGGIMKMGVDTMLHGILELKIDSRDLLVLKSFEKTEPSSVYDAKSMREWLRIYPNPASEMIHVELPGYTGSFRVSIYDLTGKPWHSGRIENGGILDVTRIPSGTYIFILRDEQNHAFRRKMLIQRME
jgi:hypothetical protein